LQIGDNVKNLVILIPNERHHGPGEDNEARFIDQSFVPEIAVVSQEPMYFGSMVMQGMNMISYVLLRMEKTNHPQQNFLPSPYL
jgi:hypothetical protein